MVTTRATTACPKCGQLVCRMDRHAPTCDRLPPPAELTKLFYETKHTVSDLGRLYGVTPDTITKWLDVDGTISLEERRERTRAKRRRETGQAERKTTKTTKCPRCTMLATLRPFLGWKVCGMCVDDWQHLRRRYVDGFEKWLYRWGV